MRVVVIDCASPEFFSAHVALTAIPQYIPAPHRAVTYVPATVRRRRPEVLAGNASAAAPPTRASRSGALPQASRRLRLARNAHMDMRTLRATAPGARVDSAQSAGKAAGLRD
ncbi:hypothetical protein [Streptomyces sp. NPDC052721]|uniref:hypothetical protein n=1 Tax=Streptomyces sp. NPDC052721 TaxID=3154955 RepID=UPI00342DB689